MGNSITHHLPSHSLRMNKSSNSIFIHFRQMPLDCRNAHLPQRIQCTITHHLPSYAMGVPPNFSLHNLRVWDILQRIPMQGISRFPPILNKIPGRAFTHRPSLSTVYLLHYMPHETLSRVSINKQSRLQVE